MPAQDCFGLNHLGRTKKAWPEPNQPNHKCPVAAAQPKTRRRPPQRDIQLMTKKQVLGFKPHTRLEHISDQHSQHMQDRNHRPPRCDDSASQRESNAGWNFRTGQAIFWQAIEASAIRARITSLDRRSKGRPGNVALARIKTGVPSQFFSHYGPVTARSHSEISLATSMCCTSSAVKREGDLWDSTEMH
jgi:hypothetical protein